ncbi:MAG: DNA repair protein RadA [Phycisphaerae bacterium]|nr:DNA repair protein RadA [Phycisphaerae bacterium]
MPKVRRVFVCRECGSSQSRWHGKCPDCGLWDSLEETTFDPAQESDPQKGLVAAWGDVSRSDGAGLDPEKSGPTVANAAPISDIDSETAPASRLTCGVHELDRVLGGGLVPGSAVLMGGEPGIGKSTLLLQAAFAWANGGNRVLYVSSEESSQQVGLRAKRLSGHSPTGPDLFVLSETNLARIVEQARRVQPRVMMIDSVQMIYKSDLPASPGSVSQLRRCCADLVYLAKASGIAVVLVGHVTKEGQLAGPRLLEHLVDCVLNFEGDRYHSHRVVRAVKNRFGTTLEIGLFEMTGAGLREVPEGAGVPAALATPRPGCIVCPVMTGTRCILVEVQALTATGFLGAAKRKSSGLDANRLAMVIAVLEQHAGLRLADRDIFASSVGGVKVAEPAADLALLLAIAGAHYRRGLAGATAAVGEVGLGGEIRPVPHAEARVREAARLGYTRLLFPALHAAERKVVRGIAGVDVVEVTTVDKAIEQLG